MAPSFSSPPAPSTDCFFGGETLAEGSTWRLPRGDAVASRADEAGAAGASASSFSPAVAFLAVTSSVADVGIVAWGFLSPPSPLALTVAAGAFEGINSVSCVVLRATKIGNWMREGGR